MPPKLPIRSTGMRDGRDQGGVSPGLEKVRARAEADAKGARRQEEEEEEEKKRKVWSIQTGRKLSGNVNVLMEILDFVFVSVSEDYYRYALVQSNWYTAFLTNGAMWRRLLKIGVGPSNQHYGKLVDRWISNRVRKQEQQENDNTNEPMKTTTSSSSEQGNVVLFDDSDARRTTNPNIPSEWKTIAPDPAMLLYLQLEKKKSKMRNVFLGDQLHPIEDCICALCPRYNEQLQFHSQGTVKVAKGDSWRIGTENLFASFHCQVCGETVFGCDAEAKENLKIAMNEDATTHASSTTEKKKSKNGNDSVSMMLRTVTLTEHDIESYNPTEASKNQSSAAKWLDRYNHRFGFYGRLRVAIVDQSTPMSPQGGGAPSILHAVADGIQAEKNSWYEAGIEKGQQTKQGGTDQRRVFLPAELVDEILLKQTPALKILSSFRCHAGPSRRADTRHWDPGSCRGTTLLPSTRFATEYSGMMVELYPVSVQEIQIYPDVFLNTETTFVLFADGQVEKQVLQEITQKEVGDERESQTTNHPLKIFVESGATMVYPESPLRENERVLFFNKQHNYNGYGIWPDSPIPWLLSVFECFTKHGSLLVAKNDKEEKK